MLKFTFSQEQLERAVADDLLLRHMVRDQWFALPERSSALAADETIPNRAIAQPVDWKRWPQGESKDS